MLNYQIPVALGGLAGAVGCWDIPTGPPGHLPISLQGLVGKDFLAKEMVGFLMKEGPAAFAEPCHKLPSDLSSRPEKEALKISEATRGNRDGVWGLPGSEWEDRKRLQNF